MTRVILDGPVGTELARRGVPTPLPLWTAAAIEDAPDVLAEIHRDYAIAGAQVHTANTFRTDPYSLRHDPDPDRWHRLTLRAVEIARSAVGPHGRIAGSIAPLEDCYRPDLAPPSAVAEPAHTRMAEALAEAGADLLLCETFANPTEALIAVKAAVRTGLPTWLAVTVGPSGSLASDLSVEFMARHAAALGAGAILINCSRPRRVTQLLPRIATAGTPFGAYANVGEPDPVMGWRSDGPSAPAAYTQEVLRWVDAGATVLGGCCGTTPAHIAALVAALDERNPGPREP